MSKRTQKRFWQVGCLVLLLLVVTIFVWLFTSTSQIPTENIITQRTVFALHGPLHLNDEGVKAVWEKLTAKWQSEGMPAWRVLKWLGVPRELTVAFYTTQPSPLGAVAVNFQKGFRWLWLPVRIFGKHYKGAHYIILSQLVAGMYGGTVIAAKDEVTFCHAVDNIERAIKGEKPTLKFTRQLSDRYDFVGFINPQLLSATKKIQLPANLGEIGLDIVNANELRCSVFWICQGEREAEAIMKALGKIESEIIANCVRKRVQCSFHKQREGVFIWWEFRLTNFLTLLF